MVTDLCNINGTLLLIFVGYAYLRNVIPEWMYLLKALDTFSIVTVWAAAAHTTYNAAPRSLVASCQAIIVTLYCSLGNVKVLSSSLLREH